MSTRLPVAPAPEPLEAYAQHFDALFTKRNQRDRFRRYLEGVLLPTERNKTLTALANTEPVVGAQHRQAQSLQWFLSESTWDSHTLNGRRLDLLRADPTTAPDQRASSPSMKPATAKMGTRPLTLGANIWPISARPTMASSRSPASGLTSASIIPWRSSPTRRPTGLHAARPTRPFAPSRRSR